MDGMNRIIERNIKKAIDQGTFNDLPGKGKAQRLADLRFIPPEQRAAFLALRNSGSLPPEMELRKEISRLEEQLQIASEQDRPGIMKAITEKKMFYDILMERRKR
ncbi:hypothetical protein SOV_36930 [Sporomusa ovata DSM 2662]|uniref:DnaJ homologue subfamily C member 28 conserved domain-containing protein n=1 Tax=Sporomusa ovata TaxID=2378 RepID=A0A0U1L662_9FIRM|nr:DnaJ family domain-containing protein [Sporomusa ovata]EQB24842.1 hypothetical protein DUF1992 [Sporomusa ovata DSM 2662]CQR75188.1 hypothetical protein SpAn4DRAFT_4552 [Sporomusa ovata]